MTAEPVPTLPNVAELVDLQAKVALLEEENAEARRQLMEERIRRQDVEKERAQQRGVVTKLKNELAGKRKLDPGYEVALKLWEFWRRTCKPKARRMSPAQLKALLSLLDAKIPGTEENAYTPRYIAEAIKGCAGDHFVSNGKHHNGLELICSKLEDCHERYERSRDDPASTA